MHIIITTCTSLDAICKSYSFDLFHTHKGMKDVKYFGRIWGGRILSRFYINSKDFFRRDDIFLIYIMLPKEKFKKIGRIWREYCSGKNKVRCNHNVFHLGRFRGGTRFCRFYINSKKSLRRDDTIFYLLCTPEGRI